MNKNRLLSNVWALMRLTFGLILLACSSWPIFSGNTVPPRVASVQVRVNGTNEIRPIPYCVLGRSEGIQIDFDLIGNNTPMLCYDLTLLNADGSVAGVSPIEYMSGFSPADLEAGHTSRGTLVPYVHYSLSLPNDRLSPIIGGNYRISIAHTDSPNEPFLIIPFAVVEPRMIVRGEISPQTKIDYRDKHQQVNVEVSTNGQPVYDPTGEVCVKIYRNGCPSDVQTLTRPSALGHGKLLYADQEGAVFEAGNEYRRFEALGANQAGMGVSHFERTAEGYDHLYLFADKPRADQTYIYDEDHSGLQVIRSLDTGVQDPTVEADYNLVRFTLMEFDSVKLHEGKLLLEGDAFRYLPQPAREMRYNAADRSFSADVLLKQGYVEYIYQAVPGRQKLDPNVVEGNYYQTTNVYTAFVFYRSGGDRYDRLVGVCLIK